MRPYLHGRKCLAAARKPPLQPAFDDPSFIFRDPVELVNEIVNFRVCGGDFAVDTFNLRRGELARMLLLVQFEHPVNQIHHLVAPGLGAPGNSSDRRSVPGDLTAHSGPEPSVAVDADKSRLLVLSGFEPRVLCHALTDSRGVSGDQSQCTSDFRLFLMMTKASRASTRRRA